MGRTWKRVVPCLDFPWENLVGHIVVGFNPNSRAFGRREGLYVSGIITSVERKKVGSFEYVAIYANDLQYIREIKTGNCWNDYSKDGDPNKSIEMAVVYKDYQVDQRKKSGCMCISTLGTWINWFSVWTFPSTEMFEKSFPPRDFVTVTARSA
jgi:hypothetical protein